jgi:hypothetical protein
MTISRLNPHGGRAEPLEKEAPPFMWSGTDGASVLVVGATRTRRALVAPTRLAIGKRHLSPASFRARYNLLVKSAKLRLRSARRLGRSGPPAATKSAALLGLSLLLATPASADDLITQWLKQDEAGSQTEEVRPDLNSITDEQWRDMFTIGGEQPDAFGRLLVEHGNRSQTDTFPVWLAILTAALAILVGVGIKGSTQIRRGLRRLTIPVHLNDPT